MKYHNRLYFESEIGNTLWSLAEYETLQSLKNVDVEIVQHFKCAVVGETMQYLAKMLLKMCFIKVATLWNNTSLVYQLSISNSENYNENIHHL